MHGLLLWIGYCYVLCTTAGKLICCEEDCIALERSADHAQTHASIPTSFEWWLCLWAHPFQSIQGEGSCTSSIPGWRVSNHTHVHFCKVAPGADPGINNEWFEKCACKVCWDFKNKMLPSTWTWWIFDFTYLRTVLWCSKCYIYFKTCNNSFLWATTLLSIGITIIGRTNHNHQYCPCSPHSCTCK